MFGAAHERLISLFPLPLPLPLPMPFDHERLDVYQLALEFFDLADDVAPHLPRGRGHLADQLTRAALSIVNNIAEGAGKFSKGDKRRYYLIAMGSSTESAAMLDVCLRRKLITEDTHRRGKLLLDRIVAMLVALAKNLQD
jgi:four helix bundle protein